MVKAPRGPPRNTRKYDREPLLVSHPRARILIDVGATKYRELIKDGIIETVQVGRTSMAKYGSIKRLVGE
jgi:hypothetical protein